MMKIIPERILLIRYKFQRCFTMDNLIAKPSKALSKGFLFLRNKAMGRENILQLSCLNVKEFFAVLKCDIYCMSLENAT